MLSQHSQPESAKYLVTYGVMDTLLGSNPFWHAFLILSTQEKANEPIEVKKAWSFNPAPMVQSDSLVTKLKKILGFNFDLQGNYGMWKTEEMRFFDWGVGLHGVTFEITPAQYSELQKLYKERLTQQEQAIKEAKAKLSTFLDSPNSIEIYQEEIKRSYEENRQPQLHPFQFQITINWQGISLEGSNTCKTMAIQLLRDIKIPEEQLALITENNTAVVLPKYSGELEKFFLNSKGPLRSFVNKRTNNLTFFRSWKDESAKLFWALPPQLVFTADKSENPFALPQRYIEEVKINLSKLLRLEKLITEIDLTLDNEFYRKHLLDNIEHLYKPFPTLTKSVTIGDLDHYLKNINNLFEGLSYAINVEKDEDYELKTIVDHLPNTVQQKICDILGYEMQPKFSSSYFYNSTIS